MNIKQAYSRSEEILNTSTHAVGLIMAIVVCRFFVIKSADYASSLGILSLVIYFVGVASSYAASTMYHAIPAARVKEKALARKVDHAAIYWHIAGSYTPVALSVIGGWQGWLIFILQWVMVIFGIFYKSLSRRSIPAVSLTIYLVMGWTVVFFFPLFLRHASWQFIALIALGGLFYTIGAVFYAKKAFRYHHLVWHLFINLAAASHFVAIVFYI